MHIFWFFGLILGVGGCIVEGGERYRDKYAKRSTSKN